ncbi:MAG: hypothetical protein J6W38_05160, partial [Prevotella sp.]|nr:hypothetical protein [Prevotella sp.]
YKQSRSSDYTQKIADEDMRRDNLYKLLVTYLKTYLKFSFDELISQMNELIKYYRLHVVPKGTRTSGAWPW